MGKKKQRKQKITVYGIVEGDREQLFLKHLVEVYKPRDHNISLSFENAEGGTPNSIVSKAFKGCDRQHCFAWFDEDKPLQDESRKKLADYWLITAKADLAAFLQCPLRDLQSNHNSARRNPILIVSQPVCVESLILKALGKSLPFEGFDPKIRDVQINGLKDSLENNVLHGESEAAFYRAHLPKETLEARRYEIAELNLLISMITP